MGKTSAKKPAAKPGNQMQMLLLGAMMQNMQYFASRLIRHAAKGGKFDEAGLDEIRKDVLVNLKTSSLEGVTPGQEATFFKSCDTALRVLIDDAVKEGLKDD